VTPVFRDGLYSVKLSDGDGGAEKSLRSRDSQMSACRWASIEPA